MMGKKVLRALVFASLIQFNGAISAQALDAEQIVREAFDYMRDKASVSTVVMRVHRASWERKMIINAWTRGRHESLFYIVSPPKDHGNGTLKRGREMWLYNPKINRVIKVPPSMMAQSWMGSDFSNNDLAKSDSLLMDYVHTLIGTETHGGMKVYVIRSVPKPEAPVIWGMQRLRLREDHILLSEEFFDEDRRLVKALSTSGIQVLGGKPYPRIWRMKKAGERDRYTELTYLELEFRPDLPDRVFTLSNLRHPRR